MDYGRANEKTCESKSEGRRRMGRPRWWWLEDIEYYLQEVKFQKWREKAVGRVVWAFVIKVAKAVGGPYLRWPRLLESRT
jgi:hypothetical protein